MICERELEIEAFIAEEYWKIKSKVEIEGGKQIDANLISLNGSKIEKFSFKNEIEAENVLNNFKDQKFKITDITKKPATRNPDAPFSTSTLQQVASSIFGFGASRTMQIAQKLFQGY